MRRILKIAVELGQGLSETRTVREVMTAPLISMPGTTHIGEVLAEMYRRDIRNMPVKGDREDLLGIVSMPDVLRYARAFNIDENVRQSWKEVANFWQSEDHYTPG